MLSVATDLDNGDWIGDNNYDHDGDDDSGGGGGGGDDDQDDDDLRPR